MTRKEFDKVSDRERKDVSKDFGWRQSGYLNWKITQGYYFAVFHLSLPEAYLTVKPLYVDDLWWGYFRTAGEQRSPKSLRGNGAFAVSGQRIGTYDAFTGNPAGLSTETINLIWQEVFTEIERDADRFLEKHPDAETFIPDEKDGQTGHDRLLQLMTLLRNRHVNEARNIILQAKAEAFGCMLQAEHGSSHDYILRWIDRIQA